MDKIVFVVILIFCECLRGSVIYKIAPLAPLLGIEKIVSLVFQNDNN